MPKEFLNRTDTAVVFPQQPCDEDKGKPMHCAVLSIDPHHHKDKMGNVVTENPNRLLESP